MKNYIFKKKFNEIFTKERLEFESKKLNISINVDNFFDFAPHNSFLLPKDDGGFREISVPDTKTKIIQTILIEEFNYVFKFSDRNYAYQKNKSPLKAINRVKHIITNFNFVIKCDIKSFFDTIDQDILLKKLEKIIQDRKIIYLIAIFLKNGALFKDNWKDKLEGVYQGDVLSPFLANVYLHNFDISLEKRGIEFVRYADDFILFSKDFNEAKHILSFVKNRLRLDNLSLNNEKTHITHKNNGFEFLGVRFDVVSRIYSIDNDRLMKKISKISTETKKLDFLDTITKLNQHIIGFKNYYMKIINNPKQLELLQQKENEIIISKIIKAKEKRIITNKNIFLNHLKNLYSYTDIKDYDIFIINEAYEQLKLKNYKKEANKKIDTIKKEFVKNQLRKTELIVSKMGSYLSFGKNKIKVKTVNEPIKEIPFKKIKRIIITTTRCSISTYLIYQCSKNKIDIDFIENNEPYALITYHKSISKELHLKQMKLITSDAGLNYAKNLYVAKAKNQVNLIQYFNYRRKDKVLYEIIEKIDKFIDDIKMVKEKQTLMGFEGKISALYWKAFGHIIKNDNFTRTHQNSTDTINQALNYGYGILYNRIQSELVKNSLNLYYSLLHSVNYKKPTLVYDFIEPFRSPIVDREIISILNKKQKISLNKDYKLTEDSKKLIIQHIQDRLSTITQSRYGKTTYFNIISFEANSFKLAIEKGETNHKFFINKY